MASQQKKRQKNKLAFLELILKQGIDTRSDGIVWLMREVHKLGGDIREDCLPDFIDGDSKEFLDHKYRIYNQWVDIKERIDFLLEFYKQITGKTYDLGKTMVGFRAAKRAISSGVMERCIEETNSISIKQDRWGSRFSAAARPYSQLSVQSRYQGQAQSLLQNSCLSFGGAIPKNKNPFITETRTVDKVIIYKEQILIQDEVPGGVTSPVGFESFAKSGDEVLAKETSLHTLDYASQQEDQPLLPAPHGPEAEHQGTLRGNPFHYGKDSMEMGSFQSKEDEIKEIELLNSPNKYIHINSHAGLKSAKVESRVAELYPGQVTRAKLYSAQSYQGANTRPQKKAGRVLYIGDQDYKFPYEARVLGSKASYTEYCYQQVGPGSS
jgi:hypothetical protein